MCENYFFPKEESILKFIHYERIHDVLFVIYADFECSLKPINKDIGENTKQFQKHKMSGYCYLIKCFDDSLYKPKLVRYTKKSDDEDVALKFVESLKNSIRQIHQQFKFPKKMIFGEKEKEDFEKAKNCYACDEKFKKEYIVKYNKYDDDVEIITKTKKVADHCHYTGKYHGAACISCNSKMRKPKFVPVIFHNLQNYDSHLFIKAPGVTEGKVNCIQIMKKNICFMKEIVVDQHESKEMIVSKIPEEEDITECEEFIDEEDKKMYKIRKMITVKKEIRFIDSFKFMSTGLGKLVENLDKNELNVLKKFYKKEKTRELVTRKGVFPYDWFDNIEKLNTVRLPEKKEFYSKLNEKHITNEEYKHAKNVLKKFNMKNMREYHDFYLKNDVLHLADVFENFRQLCKKTYRLNPAWYFTTPGLGWDAMLKITGIELELLSDSKMYLMIENGIRGGISQISKRYSKANNKYMGKDYDSKEENVYISYLDANNLYGWAMSKKLPVRDFEWMDDEELKNWKKIPCILEVDLEYPKQLQDLHRDYPLAPERRKFGEMKNKKLVPNLCKKEKYVVHYENLKLYEELGLKITKIHKGIKFHEEDFMKAYIDLNTELRTNAKNEFEKDFYKLMNNAVFGKTMENLRKRSNIKLTNREEQALNLFSKTNFNKIIIFSDHLAAIHMYKRCVKLNKPIYLGMSILDLSKTLMYDFHYNFIKQEYDGEKAKLLFTDTDSLMYEIHTEDFYKDISPYVETMFDTSNYPKNHPSEITAGLNKKVIGMFKDECGGKQITEFVGLRSKVYAFKIYENDEEVKKCKGIKKNVIKNNMIFQTYYNCLCNGEEKWVTMNLIRSRKHEL